MSDSVDRDLQNMRIPEEVDKALNKYITDGIKYGKREAHINLEMLLELIPEDKRPFGQEFWIDLIIRTIAYAGYQFERPENSVFIDISWEEPIN